MDKYNVLESPNADTWLSIDEGERIAMVEEYVTVNEKEINADAIRLHASIHVVVENQLALNADPTPETYSRLMRQGLSRHEAIHAIGAIVTEDLYDKLKGNPDKPAKNYKNRLKKLTAKRWRKGKW